MGDWLYDSTQSLGARLADMPTPTRTRRKKRKKGPFNNAVCSCGCAVSNPLDTDIRGRNICHYCRRRYGYFIDPLTRFGTTLIRTIDHIVPKSRGGTNEYHNLVFCCHVCNSAKANRYPDHGDCEVCDLAIYFDECDRQSEGHKKFLRTLHIGREVGDGR